MRGRCAARRPGHALAGFAHLAIVLQQQCRTILCQERFIGRRASAGAAPRWSFLPLPTPPTCLRETFELFRFYRPDVGIDRLLESAGVAGMSPRQVYQAVHDRPPDSLAAALPRPDRTSIQHFVGAVTSREFRARLPVHLFRAFPEKRRLFFVHIPKTAGVDLASHLQSRFPSFNTRGIDTAWPLEPQDLFLTLKFLA